MSHILWTSVYNNNLISRFAASLMEIEFIMFLKFFFWKIYVNFTEKREESYLAEYIILKFYFSLKNIHTMAFQLYFQFDSSIPSFSIELINIWSTNRHLHEESDRRPSRVPGIPYRKCERLKRHVLRTKEYFGMYALRILLIVFFAFTKNWKPSLWK